MASIEPDLVVPDVPAAAQFYAEAFGATEQHRVPDGGVIQLEVQGASFWLSGEGSDRRSPAAVGSRSAWLILVVDDPDALWARAVDAGATPENEMTDDYGWRVGSVVDPWGQRWEIGKRLGAEG
ncbi:VOC family protein [Cellulomonas sp. URHD0024]|uniref:VOC family protein n=1 Tax=Cellulomonas sp. URHD0024 TaxID=1302620 RepID=UPI00048037EA|nr:VOC family protein [Cellulomonas sp. URHD0024]